MIWFLTVAITLSLFCYLPGGKVEQWKECLPANVKLEDVVSVEPAKSPNGGVVKITVYQTLSKLKARCRKGKLFDATGRKIRFYHLIGCWGNPPEDYQEQLDKQSRELNDLKKKYRVIEIQCAGLDPRTVL